MKKRRVLITDADLHAPRVVKKKTRRILVVDDDTHATRMVKWALERTGRYEARELNDPTQVLDAAREFKPDLILLDVCMPGREGCEVAFQIRADAEFQSTPIVFLTSLVSEQEAVGDGTSAGAFHFVAKPARVQRMIACIEKSLEMTPCGDRVPANTVCP
ncbi:MAG: response regulator [Verrucomicrobiia bacterium]|jgi:two-component system response regulator MtrA